MTVEKGTTPAQFNLEGLTFNEMTTIKKACEAFAKQGSAVAGKVAVAIEDALNNMTI